jgi:hypothetical protein
MHYVMILKGSYKVIIQCILLEQILDKCHLSNLTN